MSAVQEETVTSKERKRARYSASRVAIGQAHRYKEGEKRREKKFFPKEVKKGIMRGRRGTAGWVRKVLYEGSNQ